MTTETQSDFAYSLDELLNDFPQMPEDPAQTQTDLSNLTQLDLADLQQRRAEYERRSRDSDSFLAGRIIDQTPLQERPVFSPDLDENTVRLLAYAGTSSFESVIRLYRARDTNDILRQVKPRH